jgi:uncharacterized protein YeeX (DUF496 family)
MKRNADIDLLKLNRDEDSHFEMIDMSVDEMRKLIDGIAIDYAPFLDDFTVALDEAQGAVGTGNSKTAYIIVRVS